MGTIEELKIRSIDIFALFYTSGNIFKNGDRGLHRL